MSDKEIQLMDLDSSPNKKKSKNNKKQKNKNNKVEKKEKRSKNREFYIVTYFFLALFLLLILYFIYFVQFKADSFINSPYNARLEKLEENVIRGDITDCNGNILATTDTSSGTEVRKYPYGRMFAHAIGYKDKGMSGVELDGNFNLLTSHAFILERISNEINDKKNIGDTIVTTLDLDVQSAAYNGMGSYKGAAIAIDPTSGKIIAMVSLPDYNPATISQDWDDLVDDSDSSALINRATQGKYPPGSTFKIVTALEYLRENNLDTSNFNYDCSSSLTVDNYTIHCSHNKAHGQEDFSLAFANSCNCAFADIGLGLKMSNFNDTASDLMFNQTLPTKLSNVNKSTVNLSSDLDQATIMQTSIGQSSTTVTPIHMCLIAAAIANDGWVYKPYIIDKITNYTGTTVKTTYKSRYKQIMTDDEANTLSELMRYVVTNGTASSLNNQSGYTCYGKTGTAEYSNDKNSTHSWFVGYATSDSDESKQLAVAVILEGAGTGSDYAVPVAKKMFQAYFN